MISFGFGSFPQRYCSRVAPFPHTWITKAKLRDVRLPADCLPTDAARPCGCSCVASHRGFRRGSVSGLAWCWRDAHRKRGDALASPPGERVTELQGRLPARLSRLACRRGAELGDRRRAQGGGADLTIARLPNHSASKRGFHSVSFSSGSVASKLCATNSRMASRSLTF